MTPGEYLKQNLDKATARMGDAARGCAFDRATVAWIDAELRRLRDRPGGPPHDAVPVLGTLLGQCFVESFGGIWAQVNNGGFAVKIGAQLCVVPWNKIEGFLGGDDGDQVLGFFDGVGKRYVGKTFDRVQMIF